MRNCGEAAAARRRVSLTEPLRSTRLVPQTYPHSFVFHAFLPIPMYSYVLLCIFLSTTESANVILRKMSVEQLPFISLKHRTLVTFFPTYPNQLPLVYVLLIRGYRTRSTHIVLSASLPREFNTEKGKRYISSCVATADGFQKDVSAILSKGALWCVVCCM